MDLSDRRCRHRSEGEPPEMTVPAHSPVGVEYTHQLAHRHGFGVRAQAGQDIAKLGRQQIACIHGQQLPELHRCTAQAGKLIGNAVGVLRRQQQVANSRTLALG
jgi:hypothetical protein